MNVADCELSPLSMQPQSVPQKNGSSQDKSKKKSKKSMKQRTLIINSSAINTMCGESEQIEGAQQKLEIRENIGEPLFVIEKIPSNTVSSNTNSGSGGSNENSKGSNPSKKSV